MLNILYISIFNRLVKHFPALIYHYIILDICNSLLNTYFLGIIQVIIYINDLFFLSVFISYWSMLIYLPLYFLLLLCSPKCLLISYYCWSYYYYFGTLVPYINQYIKGFFFSIFKKLKIL